MRIITQLVLSYGLFMFVTISPGRLPAQTTKNHTLAASKPPMGWNSWPNYGISVTEQEVKYHADYMHTNLKKFGWEYVVVDMAWYSDLSTEQKAEGTPLSFRKPKPEQSIDAYGRVIPSELKFPSSKGGKGFKPLADYVHAKGLKFGVHIMRGIPWQAVEQNTPIEGTSYTSRDIVSYQHACDWYNGMLSVDWTKPGTQHYFNSLYKQLASWGVDFVKVDDMSYPYSAADIEGVRKAIELSGRNIVLSLSPGSTPFSERYHVQMYADMFRISRDFWDSWRQLKEQFRLCAQWVSFQQPGHWADADMLILGNINERCEMGAPRYTNFTKDEQITLMTLWTIFKSPLMIGSDFSEMDEWTLSLLTNSEVLEVNQTSTGPRIIYRPSTARFDISQSEMGDTQIWTSESPDKKCIYVAFFNLSDKDQLMEIDFQDVSLKGEIVVRDLWKRNDIGRFNMDFKTSIKPHSAGLFKLSR